MDSAGRPSVVVLKGRIDGYYDEMRAAGAITPGHLLLEGSAGTVTVLNTAAMTPVTFPGLLIATEDAQVLQGKGIDDAYASGDVVSVHKARKGDLVQVWLKDGENVAVGALLETATAGQVQATTTGKAILRAEEALNLVGGAAAPGRIRASVL